ncbi:MAG: outer membrane protein assembly factor BamE [Aquabacterium sp.]|jgi:outer membrane protein assembly factor BamE|uniref:outer membrane protein assembly factor BamE n=1 Tax=Aquabacterium sp. TaxID=1872578 RepID=UPI001B4BA16C|nr:outer membrane protein assembly factor BamE [Aquabacterium sp.]MBP9063207.1 outer membrane protein assembly factor BamE [Aquabacterium sp.]MDQ5926755.1 outer membrane protein assembly factor BamE [Pseudomonadota bacterium]
MTQTLLRRALLALAPVVLLTACGTTDSVSWNKPETLFGLLEPYRVDVVQGNVVTQEVMALVQPGLGRAQVREILGTPLLADPFHANRWDYVFTIRRQGVPDQKRTITVFFENDVVARFDTAELPTENDFVASIAKPLDRKDPPANLTPEQVAQLPVPPQIQRGVAAPQGATRSYPPLEGGAR